MCCNLSANAEKHFKCAKSRCLLLYYEYLKCKPAKPNQKSLIMIKKIMFIPVPVPPVHSSWQKAV